MNNKKNRMVTVQEASSIVCLSSFAIRNLCKQNQVRFINSGRKVYISLPSLLNYCGLEEGGEADER